MLGPFALASSSLQLPAGGVRRDDATCSLMVQAAREVCAVARSRGAALDPEPVVTALLSAMLIQDVPLRAVWAGGLLSFAGVGLKNSDLIVFSLSGRRVTAD